ncbi:MAG TPA: NAD(P)-dependent oxidoreductase [Hyphomicrobiaceae bacterium]|nr:NAD(P)-dependent oxidoreductase [Hyphomicrobiaceae bacterium]
MQADLTDPAAVEQICDGVEGIVHLGGYSVEGPWADILNANIIGCYNLFEAARVKGVRRIIFASSNHAAGFYPRTTTIAPDVTLRPDSRYGVSKAFGEALGAMYAYKHGIGVTCLRIGNVGDAPLDERRLAIWLHPEDLVRQIKIGLERPGLVYEVIYGVSNNVRSWYDNSHAESLGYTPAGESESFVAEAMARQADLAPDPVGDFYQGGTFCAEEYTADFERMKSRS